MMAATCGFYLDGDYTSGNRYRTVGGRLLYVPQTKVCLNALSEK